MATKTWRKGNRIFAIDQNELFQKSNTLELISKLNWSLTTHGKGDTINHPIESLKALRPFLRYFQLFGFFPVAICPVNTNVKIKKASAVWFFTAISLAIHAVMTARAIRKLIEVSLSPTKKTSDEVSSANSVVYFAHTLSMTLIMIQRLHLLPSFFESCKKVEQLCVKYEPNNDRLVKHCWFVFGCFVCTQLMGNMLHYYAQVERNNDVTSISEFSDDYDLGDEKSLKSTFPGVPYSILELYCEVGWTFGDILIALMSLILTRFFIRFNKGISASHAQSVEEVERLRKDHRALKDLVEECNHVFSPIILVNFMGNVIYLLTRLYTMKDLSKDLQDSKLIVRVESIYAFVYQISKIMVPTWLAALLQETAAEAIDTVHDWPSLIELPESRNRMMVITRFVSQLIHDPVGLHGCGYFIITKSFLVTLISGIMTYEVIILQFQQSGQ